MRPQLEVIFAREGLRLTAPRITIFTVMQEARAPLAVADIAKKCPKIDRVSVYRTIDLFVQLGIAGIVPVGWKRQYELTSPFKSHHHHLHCTKCGLLIDLHSQKLEQLAAAIARASNFEPTEHKFEISGICENCR